MITMTREELLEKVRNSAPQLDFDYKYPNLFKKYGYVYDGIGCGWRWKDNLSDASDEELLEMWAITGNYWLEKYEEWYHDLEKRHNELKKKVAESEAQNDT